MKTIKYKVQDEYGFHARPASQMVEICQQGKAEVQIESNGKQADFKRLFSVLELGIKQNEQIEITIKGEDEDNIFHVLSSYIEQNKV